jgi:phosphoglycerate dehydrogenase-like enzyme
VTLLVHSRWSGGDPSEPQVRKATGIEEVLRRADVISLHTPLTDETRGLLSRQAISMMKQGAYLINTARGGLVDEHALAAAIASGRLGGAALDVFSDEPLPNGHPLTVLDNVVLSPHVAGASDRSGPKMGLAAAANVLAALNGDELPLDVVTNPSTLTAGRLATS